MASKETDRLNQFARRNGYNSYYKYQVMRRILSGRVAELEKLQQEFEDSMGQLSCVSLGEMEMVRDFVPCVDLEIDVKEAIKTLEGVHYSGKNVAGYSSGNPDGNRYAEIIRSAYLEGRNLEEIGHGLGITGARVRQLRDKGLKYLRHILGNESFR
jgi:hypothetical protein